LQPQQGIPGIAVEQPVTCKGFEGIVTKVEQKVPQRLAFRGKVPPIRRHLAKDVFALDLIEFAPAWSQTAVAAMPTKPALIIRRTKSVF
jgi:hypothetical protein